MSTNSPEVAILVYQAAKKRSEDESFDGLGNLGVEVIADVLRRSGIEVGYCSPESAREHLVVLVSMTSTYDLLALTQAVGRMPSWKAERRPFRVVAERATPGTDKLWEAICFAPKLQSNPSADKVRRVSTHFDLAPYLRKYDIDEPHPADFLTSFTPRARLREIARDMRRRADG